MRENLKHLKSYNLHYITEIVLTKKLIQIKYDTKNLIGFHE